jgi:hypothetical protein
MEPASLASVILACIEAGAVAAESFCSWCGLRTDQSDTANPLTNRIQSITRHTMTLIVIILLVVFFGGGIGWYGHNQWGSSQPYAGPGIGIGTILILLLILYLLGIL